MGNSCTMCFKDTTLARDEIVRKRIVFLGSTGVGKSAIINRLINRMYDEEYKPTVEEIYSTDFKHISKKVQVEIIDTSGVFHSPDMLNIYIKTADLIILVFSCDSARSFEEVLQKQKTAIDVLELEDPRVVAVCSKMDLQSNKEITYAEAELRLIEIGTVSLIETSAKSNIGIQELKHAIVKNSF